jgi:nucleoside-diphosphate-sugar epimerase
MSTLVTGGTGFVGANIVRELARAGHEVVSYDISSADDLVRQFVADWEGAITFVQGDIRDGEAVSALANGYGIDKIIHAATYTVNQHELEVERGRDVVGINVEGLANVLELARIASVRRFLYVSSGAAYGTAGGTDQTYSEDMPVSPEVMYAVTKYAGELITRRYGALHGFSTVSVRLSTPYGPMERVTGHRAVMSALYQWTGQIARGEPLSVQGESFDPEDGRDYTYSVDTARGLQAILDAPELPHDLYNLTTGVWITYREILEALAELAPGSAPAPSPAPATGGGEAAARARASVPSRGPLSGHRLRQDLGWRPDHDLRAALADYLEWRRDTGFSG